MTDKLETAREIEALLFAAAGPLTEKDLASRLPEGADVTGALEELGARYAGRGVVLAQAAGASRPPRTWPG